MCECGDFTVPSLDMCNGTFKKKIRSGEEARVCRVLKFSVK